VAASAVEIDGRPAMVLVWHDLTERKRAEEQLLRLGERLKDANRQLEAVNLRMKCDLDAAAQVQQSLLFRRDSPTEYQQSCSKLAESGSIILTAHTHPRLSMVPAVSMKIRA
jgi:hypothetical protein